MSVDILPENELPVTVATEQTVSKLAKRQKVQVDFVVENPRPNSLVRFSDQAKRKAFASNLEYVITVISEAVGLGNVWRFPYVCYKNGGAAFFIPYTLMLVIAALPIMGMEMAWGQFTSLGPLESWNYYPLLGGVSLAGIFITFLIVVYYAVLTAYALFYLGVSIYSLADFNNPVWNGCQNYWNTENCVPLNEIQRENVTLQKSSYNLPTDEFWLKFASQDSGSIRNFGYPNWKMVIALFVTWTLVFASLYRGVQSMGKANYFFAFFPYFCILFLVFAGIFTEGAAEGILVYLIPKFEKLLDVQVWADAGQQIFFSLSLCQGVVQTLSSFNGFRQQCLQNTLIVVVVNCVTSFWVGIPIFAVLGHMAHNTGTTVDEVIDSGPGLAFIAYPQALSLLPGAAIWSIVFCAMLFAVGLGSCTADTEATIALVTDVFPWLALKKKREILFRFLYCVAIFLLGLPIICGGGMELLEIIDTFSLGINSYIIGILEVVTICYLYGYRDFERDVSFMIGHRPNCYWRVTWKYLCPLFLLFMGVVWIINRAQDRPTRPYWATRLGWLMHVSTIVVIPLYAAYVLCKEPSGLSTSSYRAVTRPNDKWGPADEEDRKEWYALKREQLPTDVAETDVAETNFGS